MTKERIPLRIIEILLEDDADTVERILNHIVDEDFPCCDGSEDAECALLTASATKVYMSEETGAFYEKPEGGLPIHTQDLDDWQSM